LKQHQASAQRMGLAQIVEGVNTLPLQGKTIIFQAMIKCSSSQNIRAAILEWTGGIDSPTSDVVNNWTSGTYTAGNFFLASNLAITAVSDAVKPDAATWTQISVSGIVTLAKNLIVMIWTEGTAAQNVTLDITEAGVYVATAVQNWCPRPIQQELALCQRYYEKSYDLDVPPGTTGDDHGVPYSFCPVTINAYTGYYLFLGANNFKITKRIVPYAILLSMNTGATSSLDLTGGTRAGSSAPNPSQTTLGYIFIDNTGAATQAPPGQVQFHWIAFCEL
jgi:hypothetical protein